MTESIRLSYPGSMSSPRIEEYLEALYKLQEKTGQPVNISRLAENMKLSVPSASEMMKKLSQLNLIAHNRQREVLLTETGLEQSRHVVRRHRLAERFLTDMLGLPWDQVHDEACLLEHALSPLVEERLAERLGNPRTCPHGHSIPGQKKQSERRLISLAELKTGVKACIATVGDEDPEILRYLAKLEFRPGTDLIVKEIAPFGGPITVTVKGKDHAVGPELAAKIMCEGSNLDI